MAVIGISDEKERVVVSMKNPHIEYFNAIDTQKRMKNVVQVKGIPHVMIIDTQGTFCWEGFPFLSGHELTETVVENLLREHGAKQKSKGKYSLAPEPPQLVRFVPSLSSKPDSF